jgi:hypothetical protein
MIRHTTTSSSPTKVRLQTQAHGAARMNMLQMFGHVARNDGVMALYRGVRLAGHKDLEPPNVIHRYLLRNFANRPTV